MITALVVGIGQNTLSERLSVCLNGGFNMCVPVSALGMNRNLIRTSKRKEFLYLSTNVSGVTSSRVAVSVLLLLLLIKGYSGLEFTASENDLAMNSFVERDHLLYLAPAVRTVEAKGHSSPNMFDRTFELFFLLWNSIR